MMKNYKTAVLVFFILFTCNMSTCAQETPTFQEKPRKVKMPKCFLTDLPGKPIPITGIDVIQAARDLFNSQGYPVPALQKA